MDTTDSKSPQTQNCMAEQFVAHIHRQAPPRGSQSPQEPHLARKQLLSVLAARTQGLDSPRCRPTHSEQRDGRQREASTECPGPRWTGQHGQRELSLPHRVCVIDTENLYRPTHLAPLARNARQALWWKRWGRGQHRIPGGDNQPQGHPQEEVTVGLASGPHTEWIPVTCQVEGWSLHSTGLGSTST